MIAAEKLITENLDIWTSAVQTKSAAGRGSANKLELYGIKKLRELILELAVRGLLVPQDPEDEPASELLKRIAAEKAQLVKDKKIKKPKALPEIEDDEKPFELPKEWEWVRLGDVTNYGTSDKAEAKDVEPDTWVLELEDVEKVSSRLLAKVRFSERQFRSSKNVFYEGDVIYGKLRPYLDKVLVANESGVCTTEMIPVRGYACLVPSFLRIAMKWPGFIAYANESTHGMNLPRMGTAKARMALIPLLSESEQSRIVAKVDELMALCDQLEQQQESSITAHQTLVQTLLDALTTASERDGFIAAWARIADHFDTLFTTEWSIDQLKQTILQLAVMGKLVPQDPNDEPALDVYSETIELPCGYTRSNKQNIRGKNLVDIKYLAALPKGWGYFSVDNLYKTNHILDYEDGNHGSLYPRKSDFGDEGVIFLTAAQIDKRGNIDWVECPRLKYDYAKKLTKGWSEEGDVYFTHNATVGRTAIARSAPEKRFLLGTSVTLFRINGFSISPGYLYTYFSSPAWYNQAAAVMQQTTRNQVSITKQALFYIALPPLKEQQKIVAKIDELMPLCNTLKANLNTAQTTQLHLADALSGQAVS